MGTAPFHKPACSLGAADTVIPLLSQILFGINCPLRASNPADIIHVSKYICILHLLKTGIYDLYTGKKKFGVQSLNFAISAQKADNSSLSYLLLHFRDIQMEC